MSQIAAFDIVNRELLFTRLKIMGIPEDITSLRLTPDPVFLFIYQPDIMFITGYI